MSTAQPAIAVLGTGTLGAPIARNLARAGFPVRAWNRTASKAEALAPDGVTAAATPTAAAEGADIVLTIVGDGPQALELIQAANPAPGTVWVQISTVGEYVDELAAHADKAGLTFVDAPVAGTKQPAEQGKLTVLGAAAPSVRPTVQPLFDVIGARTIWVAEEPGAASRLKLALNTWVINLTHSVGEAIALTQQLGLDPRQFLDVVTGGPLDSGYLQAKSALILSGDYEPSFTVDNAAKDARLALEAADRAGVRLDLTAAAKARFERASRQGHGGEDMAAGYFASFDEKE
ncbi:NAD(P)-dependent oxidoreductase [Streptomyces sp. A7024]|uniref:NAD(P)-dependent oxidoreductase n=1 Tax=Streptomyces coryli TaxID=1128680 RepID=A0A6G4UDR9_9ACTN|nr:NAD(P)-dependent oxidoreductase [Streptomyces coryli]NGN70314.1 NAD(P)-dependent oxidoreductase [Streptomyces coryli]